MPAVQLAPRQAPATTTELAQTSATRFLHAASSSAAGSSGDSGSASDSGVSIWKYAIVVLLCAFALGALVRLGFLHRLRRQRAVYTQEQRRPRRPQGPHLRRDSLRSLNGSMHSVDFDEATAEPPPPAYDDGESAGAAAPPAEPAPAPAPAHIQDVGAKRSPLARFKSLFHRSDTATTSVPMQHLPATDIQTHANRPANPATLAEVTRPHGALRDAGFIGARGPSRTLAGLSATHPAALHGASPSVLAAAAAMAGIRPEDLPRREHNADEEERRRAERAYRRVERRQRRSDRDAQRERDEGLGLPTYSRQVGAGEATLQRAEGWKTDGSDDDDDDESGESGDEAVVAAGGTGGAQAVLPVLEREPQPRASTSSARAASSPTDVQAVEPRPVSPPLPGEVPLTSSSPPAPLARTEG